MADDGPTDDWGEGSEPTPELIEDRLKLEEFRLRKRLLDEMMPKFLWANVVVLVLVVALIVIDLLSLAYGTITPDQRLINSKVIMTLVGATVVQLGGIMFTITGNLFPKRKGSG